MKIKANIINHNQSFFGEVEIIDQKIKSVTKLEKDINPQFNYLLPAFVDGHVHGGYGFDFNAISTSSKEEIKSFNQKIYQEGLVHLALTTVTTTVDKLLEISKHVNENKWGFIIALHFEGPYISLAKKGSHDGELITEINPSDLERVLQINQNNKVIMTCACDEHNNSFILKKFLKQYKNLYISLGHSNATAEQALEIINSNIATRITHLFNAMSGFDHREPGIAFAALNNKKTYTEIIGDGLHVSNLVLDYTFKTIDHKKILLVSDALPAKGLQDGEYELGGLPIEKKGSVCYLKGTTKLAGSTIPYNKLVKNFFVATNAKWEDIVKVTSYNFYKSIGLNKRFGVIKKNSLANLVLIDKDFNVLKTIVEGKVVFSS